MQSIDISKQQSTLELTEAPSPLPWLRTSTATSSQSSTDEEPLPFSAATEAVSQKSAAGKCGI